ncbi:MAG: hypothetical protein HY280_02170 [Nitrospinae bacterium]|nr:hypothetical protein [Nitrospinota bacterium]
MTLKKILIGCLLLISITTSHYGLAWADEWEDHGFRGSEAEAWKSAEFAPEHAKAWKSEGFTPEEAKPWKSAGFTPQEAKAWRRHKSVWENEFTPEEAKPWKDAGITPGQAKPLNFYGGLTANEVKPFIAKYCKNGVVENWPPANPNDEDGAHCYPFDGTAFQVLGEFEALYKNGDGIYHISFGKGGKAVSVIEAVVTVRGSYKYQSMGGLKIVPDLKVLRTKPANKEGSQK